MMEYELKKTWPWLERQILLFPLIVIFLACASFFFGGHCAAWQWWVSIALVLSLPFAARENWRTGAVSGGFFLLTLAVLYVAVQLTRDSWWVDAVAYHLPATQLLINGWNPFTDATPSALGAAMQVDPEEMRVLHVLFLQKAAWIFNAVAFFFHGDAQAVTVPIEFYAFFMASIVLWRTLDTWRWPFRLLLAFALWTFCAGHSSIVLWIPSMSVVDDVCAMMIFALMVAMTKDLSLRKVSWDRIVPLTLLAIAVKSAGGLACFVLWVFFAILFLVKNRHTFGRTFALFAAAAVGMTIYFAVTCASPYLTAYRDYGHPLYPMAQADPDQPTFDFVSDLNIATADFHEMSPIGLFVNAYISPTLAQAYYRYKLGREDFSPTCLYWQCMKLFAMDDDSISATTLTTLSQRLALLAAVAILLLLPGWRVMPAMILLMLLASPSPLYGYMRYFKWAEVLFPFAILALAAFAWTKFEPRIGKIRPLQAIPLALAIIFGGIFAYGMVTRAVQDVGEKRQVLSFAPKYIYSSVLSQFHWDCNMQFFALAGDSASPWNPVMAAMAQQKVLWQEDGARVGMNAFKLLAKRTPNLQTIEVRPLTPELREKLKGTLKFDPLLAVYVE